MGKDGASAFDLSGLVSVCLVGALSGGYLFGMSLAGCIRNSDYFHSIL